MIKNTLNIVANNAHNRIITPSTTIIIEIVWSMRLFLPLLQILVLIVVGLFFTTFTIIVQAVIATITNIFLLNMSMSTNPITTTSTTSIITNICVNSSCRSSSYYYNCYSCCGWYQYLVHYYKLLLFVLVPGLMLLTVLSLPSFFLPVLDVILLLLLVPLVLLS